MVGHFWWRSPRVQGVSSEIGKLWIPSADHIRTRWRASSWLVQVQIWLGDGGRIIIKESLILIGYRKVTMNQSDSYQPRITKSSLGTVTLPTVLVVEFFTYATIDIACVV